jgi:hypothetical protein
MEHRATRLQRLVPWLLGVLLVLAMLAAGAFWFRGSFEKHWNVPHAIYSTASLVNNYHLHKAKTGSWPEPGYYVAKEVEFVRSFTDRGVRVDAFNFGGGQYALIYVHERSLEVFPVNEVPTTQPSRGAP